MKLENLRQNRQTLLSRLEADGYSAAYISRMRGMIRTILSESDERGWEDYHDIRRYYEATCKTRDTLTRKRTVIGAIMEFDLHGKFPDRTTPTLSKRGAYYKLSPEFRSLVDHYRATERERGKKESTIGVVSSNASSFLLRVQEAGADRLGDITEEIVVPLFVQPGSGSCMTFSHSKCAANVISAYAQVDPLSCQKALAAIPPVKRARKNVQYLKEHEKQAVLSALGDMSNGLSLRDRAIGTLAYYTGMRQSDMAGLDVASVDWDRDLIYINQKKTDAPLLIPLTATVGNALYEYIANERPTSECPALFLTKNKPFRRVRGIWHISDSILSAAGVRQLDGDRKGLHIFRYHVATSMMDNGVPQAVISDALGHAAPESLEAYLSADIARLRECALSIEQFPVGGEVFDYA